MNFLENFCCFCLYSGKLFVYLRNKNTKTMIKKFLTKLAVKQSLKNGSIIQVDNTKHLEETLKKMLPKMVKKDNDWYQDGFLYVRFLNDYIQIKTVSEYGGKTINITNNEDSLFSYLNYLKTFTADGKVNKPSEGKGVKQECQNKNKIGINRILCKDDKKMFKLK